jgi:hypothetical protein
VRVEEALLLLHELVDVVEDLLVVHGQAADGIRTHDLLHGKQTL